MKRYVNIILLIFIILAASLPYINSLNNSFIWDEEEIVVGNPIIKHWKYFPLIFKTDIFGNTIRGGGYYRPLYTLSFMLDYRLWGLNTFGYHVFAVILHIINALLVYLLLLKIGLGKRQAWLAGLLFALFPINCEAVSLVAARVELILSLLLLSSITLFLKGIKVSRLYFLGSALIFILAVFTKESALLLPFLLSIYVFIAAEEQERRNAIFPLSALFAIAFIYCGVRFLLLGAPLHRTLSLINEASLAERIYTLPRILLTYIGTAIFPLTLKSEYNFVVHSFRDIHVWLAAPVLALLFTAVYKFLRPKKPALFLLCWFLAGLLPYYNIIIPLHATLMEHWAYFASMGLAALMSMAIFRVMDSIRSRWIRHAVIAALAFLMLFYAARIMERNAEWRDPFVLYAKDSKREPDSFLLHCNLGVEYFRRGMMQEAKREFLASNAVCPGRGYDVAYNNLGVIYARDGDISQAVSCYKQSIALNNYELAYANLGALYNNLRMYRDAALVLEEGGRLYPLDVEIKYQLAIAYYRTGQAGAAKKAFEEVDNLEKGYSETGKYLGLL